MSLLLHTTIANLQLICRYQMRVALHICAHFGHVDLASSLLRNGIRSDEAVGEHPTRYQ